MDTIKNALCAVAVASIIFAAAGFLAPKNVESAQPPRIHPLLLAPLVVTVMLSLLTVVWLLLRAFPREFIVGYKGLFFVDGILFGGYACYQAGRRFGLIDADDESTATKIVCAAIGMALIAPAFIMPNWLTIDACASVIAIGFLAALVHFRRFTSLMTFKYCAAILVGVMVYDVFAVFFTPMLLEVATALTSKEASIPALLTFPESWRLDAERAFMLGLGDIILPGFAVMIGFREARRFGRPLLFIGPWIGYSIGMFVTLAILRSYDTAQPATIYLVPFALGGLLAAARLYGLHRSIWSPSPPPRPS